MVSLRVVVGPPCGGKSTFVAERRAPGDLVVDHDAIAAALGGPDHHADGAPRSVAHTMRRRIIDDLMSGVLDDVLDDGTAWVIHTSPSLDQLIRYRNAGATVTCVDPGEPVCLARAQDRPAGTSGAVRSWYEAPPPLDSVADLTGQVPAASREW